MKQLRDIEALRHELRSRSEQSGSSNVPIFGLRPKASSVQTFSPPGLDLSSKARIRSASTELSPAAVCVLGCLLSSMMNAPVTARSDAGNAPREIWAQSPRWRAKDFFRTVHGLLTLAVGPTFSLARIAPNMQFIIQMIS